MSEGKPMTRKPAPDGLPPIPDEVGPAVQDVTFQLSHDLSDTPQDLRDAVAFAPLAAVIGFVGLGVMYLSSSWPILGDWRKDNPKAASTVVVGLLFLLLAGSVTTLITFG